jgi:hypothetical protein
MHPDSTLPLIPPLHPEVSYGFAAQRPSNTQFFGSGRQAMKFLAAALLSRHAGLLFVLPAYTCETVIQAITEAGGELTYVDVGMDLDLDLADLQRVFDAFPGRRFALVPTSLFGAPLRNHKALFPDALVIEDRCQAALDPLSQADFQVVSFGPGKMVSGMGGGAMIGALAPLETAFAALPAERGTFSAMARAFLMEQVVLRRGWRWFRARLEGDLNPLPTALSSETIRVRSMGERRARWIMNSIEKADWAGRVRLSNAYAAQVPSAFKFDIPTDTAYLRYPVNAALKLPGVSLGRMYGFTLQLAERSRGVKMPGAARLVGCSMLPTHQRVSEAHVRSYCAALANLLPEKAANL